MTPPARRRLTALPWAAGALCWFAVVRPAAAEPKLAWTAGEGFRVAPLEVPTGKAAGFTLMPPAETGITFSNRLDDAAVVQNRMREIGSGVALGDIDGDGWVDIYFCRLEGDNVLYRNLGGWKFEDITASAGVACPNQYSTGCALADLDGDGDLDLLVNSLGGGTRAFRNDGAAHFTEVTETRLVRRFGATSMALADVDGDGDLDLYVTNYRTDTFHDHPPGLKLSVRQAPGGGVVVEPADRFVALQTPNGGVEVIEKGEGDFLYLNRGAANFIAAPWDKGVFVDEEGIALTGPPTDWGLSVIFRDLNGDGLPDLYVCNDFVYWPDRIWLNQGGKRFRAAPREAFRCVSLSSMAVDVADINRDGFDDLFVADMLSPRREFRAWQRPDTLAGAVVWPIGEPGFRPEVPRNTLHLARGDGTYAEIAQFAGVPASDWTWSALFLDVDLDGWEDLLIANGSNHDVQDSDAMAEILRTDGWSTPEKRAKSLARVPRRLTPSIAFRNRRDLRFEDASRDWDFRSTGIAYGMAMADLDNDGDLDVVINCLHEAARLHRNNSSAPRLAVRLQGAGGNTRGIGARITVRGGPVTQSQEMIAGGRYCSSDDPMRTFAAGNGAALEVEVDWRSGRRSVIPNARPNCVYEVAEAGASGTRLPPAPAPAPLFEDISSRLKHVHVDEAFDDFKRQPLLPHRLSTLGPGVTWADLDRDGFDDLLIGGGKAGRLVVLRNDHGASFSEWGGVAALPSNPRDQTTVLCLRSEDGVIRVLAGESNWEDPGTNAPPFRIISVPTNAPAVTLPLSTRLSAVELPLAAADVDGDGDLDLFVGGRVRAGRYPEGADSWILRRNPAAFVVSQTLAGAGMVSGAEFSDFDGDGDPDLILACEWDSVRVFRNDGGQFSDATAALGLQRFTGWWNGVAAGDFDEDGRMDFVATNWGRNWRTDQPPHIDIPARLYAGEFAGNQVVQTLLASADPNLSLITPWRELKAVAAAIPSVAERAPNHHAYGRASVRDLLGDAYAAARELRAATPDSTVFLNRGDHFEAVRLPPEAQFATAFGVSVADFDGDGHEDLFLAQNFFGQDAETSRQDAGTGLVLLGDGRGGFRPLGPREAGFAIFGEQRGSAIADYDRDGRVDLAVGQNGRPVRLLHNLRAHPGVRVRMQGPQENPDAIGAVLRLKFGVRLGPARELHAGGGYWSQDSTSTVLAAPEPPTALWIRWPGGRTQELAWPGGVRRATVGEAGLVPQ